MSLIALIMSVNVTMVITLLGTSWHMSSPKPTSHLKIALSVKDAMGFLVSERQPVKMTTAVPQSKSACCRICEHRTAHCSVHSHVMFYLLVICYVTKHTYKICTMRCM